MGVDEGVKHMISITNQHGTIDFEGMENTPINEMQMRKSNKKTYKIDHNKNWKKGIFEKSENIKITVTRKINYG
ncbi:MAG TPA: hypothetical protein VFG10_03795 [Saprospiraceae bacterium]|nr:hypothetical protein [Saprospiraceae bacterium]